MLAKSTINQFAETFRGRLVRPEDSDYDQVRSVWNGMIDRKPALIAQCIDTKDVINAVNFALKNGIKVSIRGGGHGVAGKAVCDNGLMIDLSKMKDVKVNPHEKRVYVGPGAKLKDLDTKTQEFNLATTGGLVSDTGIAGLTLGGGLGYLARKYGLTLDNLVSADVVTSRGELVHANETENPELFWALRGGGGNFGIVTSFEFKLHEVGPEVLAGQFFYSMDNAKQLLKAYRDLMADAPDELSCYALAVNIPPVEPFPTEFHGKTSIVLVACYIGEQEQGYSLLQPLEKIDQPILKALGPMPYTQLQQSFDAGAPKGGRYYWKAHYTNQISDEAIDTFILFVNPLPGPYSIAGFESMGGAISRVNPDSTAFPERDAKFGLGIWAGWIDPEQDDEIINWTREFNEAMVPYSTGGIYSNYLDRDDDERTGTAFGRHLERLQMIKAKYDPNNFFHMNQNIRPKS